MALDFSRQMNVAGLDEVINNERIRATVNPVTLTGNASLGTAYSTNSQGVNWIGGFGPPRTGTGAGAFSALAADLLTGIITWKNTAASTQNMNLDTAANMVAAVNQITSGAQVGDYISCLVINSTGSTGGGTITVQFGTGGSFDANQSAPVILVGASRYLFIRLTNVTSGSEAYVVYT